MSDWDFPQKYKAYITYDLANTEAYLYASSFEEAAEQYLKYLDTSSDLGDLDINNSSGEHITVSLETESKDFYVKRKYIPVYEVLSND